ncbi:GNAT family N-acetyltransferase [Mucilaginibacter sp. X5P1]|uniref:GNAT family N-acetyltransferase n=1 Tax=Mucilaginibacter sp. X5P1 TaxID=2723088 RepID=UPI001611BC84|nr:GNAT family N-acetyltransferase [Mucilaginibacter sp. X5P1]MBB6140262.1 N-acetylglutamate synthase-like GNAT family acetyltransferase [Mucilaginibacter sp. X5P1]
MSIRNAKISDAEAIRNLLEQLDYPTPDGFVEEKLPLLLDHPDQILLVYEKQGKAVGMISIHFVPQIALTGDFANISYLAVDENVRGERIGAKLEEYCTRLAAERKCDRIFVHCHIRREDAHRFYDRQGYQESRKYLVKKLNQL